MAFRCDDIELDLGDSQVDGDLVECWELMLGELESGELQLPIMSGKAHRISTYAKDSNSDQDELVELIMGDQSVSGHLLRISNSTAYREENRSYLFPMLFSVSDLSSYRWQAFRYHSRTSICALKGCRIRQS